MLSYFTDIIDDDPLDEVRPDPTWNIICNFGTLLSERYRFDALESVKERATILNP